MKAALYSQTNVPLERQKILGLVKGKLPPDEVRMYVATDSGGWLVTIASIQRRPEAWKEVLSCRDSGGA